jgi:hypothetical protein
MTRGRTEQELLHRTVENIPGGGTSVTDAGCVPANGNGEAGKPETGCRPGDVQQLSPTGRLAAAEVVGPKATRWSWMTQ